MNTVLVRQELLQQVFDIAVHSLDWGSGFLDDEQVEGLRDIALLLGVDPWLATPFNHRRKYCPGHEWVPTEAGVLILAMPTGKAELEAWWKLPYNQRYRREPDGGRYCTVCGERQYAERSS